MVSDDTVICFANLPNKIYLLYLFLQIVLTMEGTTPETGNTVQVCVCIIGPIDISYSLCIEEYVHNESCSLFF